jgi:hypothetical protein
MAVTNYDRSMPHQKNENREIDKPRQHSGNAGRSISNNWKKLSGSMKPIFIVYRQLIEVLLTNVLC